MRFFSSERFSLKMHIIDRVPGHGRIIIALYYLDETLPTIHFTPPREGGKMHLWPLCFTKRAENQAAKRKFKLSLNSFRRRWHLPTVLFFFTGGACKHANN
jgi:hypothetical protein